MENGIKYYQFPYYYDGKPITVHSGSIMIFKGEHFDLQGNRYYRDFWPCTFKYVQDGKFYIEVDGKLYYHKNLNDNNIYRFKVLNEKKIPNPCTEDDVKAGRMLLILIMIVSSIFHGRFGLWIFELICYFIWAYHKKYD